jgi:hypothetical protein
MMRADGLHAQWEDRAPAHDSYTIDTSQATWDTIAPFRTRDTTRSGGISRSQLSAPAITIPDPPPNTSSP